MGWNIIYIIIFLTLLIGGAAYSRLFIRKLRYSDYDRVLSNDELLWADYAVGDVFGKVSKGRQIGLVDYTVRISIFILFFSFFVFLIYRATSWVIFVFQPRISLSALSWYRIETAGGSIIMATLAAFVAMGWVCTIAILRFLGPAKWFKIFFKDYHDNTRSYWKSVTFDLIRKRKISTHTSKHTSADVETIIRTPYERFANISGYGTVILSGLSAIFILFDVNYKTIIYPNYIEHSPYLSLSTSTYTAQDIVGVERSCRIIVRERHSNCPRVNLNYDLVMANGEKVSLYGNGEGAKLHRQINALEHWHGAISSNQFSQITITSTHPRKIAPTEEQCVSVLKRYNRGGYNAALIEAFDLRN